ncbi:hypothetical protein TRFO_40197 [Tritrichomonas foetus]|uniref:Uncharacterized protein n=1 Tax=Tritrichomonas foetus TaxID=1144522 RepID=A0A1J4J8J5_9EUKA|nr:hypothetical protein TRFO_40197 [Tritrichomonas foetus]|eukprot:OHS93556.1 hypothetical protein TRFO_40197 [Tritrichomonas foetus]
MHYDIVRNLQKEDSKLIEEEFNNLIKENEILIKEAEVLTQEKLMERSMTYVLTETEKQKEVEVEIALVKGGLESQIPQDF